MAMRIRRYNAKCIAHDGRSRATLDAISLADNVGICVCQLHPPSTDNSVCSQHVNIAGPTRRQHSVMLAFFVADKVVSGETVTNTSTSNSGIVGKNLTTLSWCSWLLV